MKFLYRIPIIGFFYKRYRMCWRKVRHANEREARAVALRYGASLHAYQCPYCHGWHVGHVAR